MAKPPEHLQANLSKGQMQAAIKKIDRRLTFIQEFRPETISYKNDPKIEAFKTNLDKLLASIFGVESIEYQKYLPYVSKFDYAPSGPNEIVPSFFLQRDIKSVTSLLESIKSTFLEDLADLESEEYRQPSLTTKPALNDFINYGHHPKIHEGTKKLIADKHYTQAVEKGFKIVRDRLRHLTKYETGAFAFSKGKLFIQGAAAKNVEHDFNEGVRFLMMAIDMFRNEKSHTSIGDINDPVKAHHYLNLCNLAMSLLENTEIRKDSFKKHKK